MPTRKNKERERVREYLNATRSITCGSCGKVNRKTNKDVMMNASLPCQFCGHPLPAQANEQIFKRPRMSIDEQITEKGRTKA